MEDLHAWRDVEVCGTTIETTITAKIKTRILKAQKLKISVRDY